MRNLFVEKSYGQLVKFTTQIFMSTLMVLIAENYALLYNRKGAYQTFEKCVYSCDPFL